MNKSMVGAAFGAALLSLTPGAVVQAQDLVIPAEPEEGTFRIGTQPWLGYGQWHVAEAKDLFRANGLDDVELVNFTSDADVNAALASGQLEGAAIATHTAMAMAAAGLPIRIVMLLDVSTTADAIIVDGSVGSVADLKGRQVAYEEGTTSDILLNYALAQNGMSVADIERVPMPAADAGSALIGGRVPVAVTYEPYLTMAQAQNPEVKVLFTAGEEPGLVSDVFVVREEILEERPGQVVALLRAWDQALAAYEADVTEGRAIISEAVGASPEELETAFDGVEFYSLAANKEQLPGAFAAQVAPAVEAAAMQAGILTEEVDLQALIDGRWVDAAAQ